MQGTGYRELKFWRLVKVYITEHENNSRIKKESQMRNTSEKGTENVKIEMSTNILTQRGSVEGLD